ncbi:MAG: low affinity iron permease family protein [Alphaproteobacteria bacterium]|nr:low affinity iron permease family protein [Alphaproteobacteria bacterium]
MEDKPKKPADFDRFGRYVEHAVGSPITFAIAALTIIVWAITGPLFGWSDTWQLVINTGTSVITFLMVFLIQSTQSRDTRALHLKLDELIRVNKEASNAVVEAEELSEKQMQRLKEAVVQSADRK